MCGAAKAVGNAFSNPIRAATAIGTFGTSELARKTPIGNAVFSAPEKLANGLLGTKYGTGGVGDMAAAPGGLSNPDLLAQTGGAPVLANIAMGVAPKDALAGFLGVNPADWDNYVQGLSPKDASSLQATQKQLETIQSNTELRNKAVQNVINDFPNVTAKIAQARAASGQEFDDVTKGYMKQALDQTAAKFAANGGLSSGAANEAFSKTGADIALKKLDYMGNREGTARSDEYAGFNARLGEVNALRDFQNTMMGKGASEGFSAAQANLGRIQQGGMANAQMANQQQMAEQASSNALLGSIGSLAGTVIGGSMFGPAGAAVGNSFGGSVGGSFNQNAPKTYSTSYGRILGGR